MQGAHESLDRDDDVAAGSDRSFGLVLCAFFALVGALRIWKGEPWSWAWFTAAAVALILALFWTRPLKPLNRLWFQFGMLLYKIVNPIVMGLLFYLTVTPMALLLRILGKDLLRLRRDPAAKSYWIVRQPPGPPPESMKNQF
jgi:Saxitoxin biosynthesis operon protein SxtJ